MIEAIAVVVVAFVACTSGGETYTLVTDCIQGDADDGGCDSGAPYTCNNGSLPSDNDPTLECGEGYPRPNGATLFCCATPGTATPCNSTTGFVCPGTAGALQCENANPPSQSDPSLICEPYGGTNSYCCYTDAGASGVACATTDSDGGCTGSAIFYTCPPSSTPQATEPLLKCGPPTVLDNGDVSYCCTN